MAAVSFAGLAIEVSASATVTVSADNTCVRPGETVTLSLNVSGSTYSMVLWGTPSTGGWIAIKSDNSVVGYPPFSGDSTYWTTPAYPVGTHLRTYTNTVSPSAQFSPSAPARFGTRTYDYSTGVDSIQSSSATCYIGAEPISDNGDTVTWQNKTTAAYSLVKSVEYWVATQEDEEGNSETLFYTSGWAPSAPLLPNGTYTVDRWFDRPMADGNRENLIESVTLTMDTVAPTAPTNLALSGHTATAFTLSWSASTDNLGVADYEVFRNGASVGTTTGTSLVVSGLNLTTLYNMTVRARDVGGNVSPSSVTKPVWLDITKPSAPGTPQFSTPFHLTWAAATDNGGVTGYEVSLNGTVLALTTENFLDNTSLLGAILGANGPVTVKARDIVPNWSDPSPALTISTQSATASMGLAAANSGPTHVTLSWKAANDGLNAASYNIYEGTTLKGTTRELSYIDTAPSSTGNLTYKVRAVNAAGVESTAEATIVVAVPTGYTDDADHDGIPDTVESLLGTGTGTTDVASRDTTNTLLVKLHRPN